MCKLYLHLPKYCSLNMLVKEFIWTKTLSEAVDFSRYFREQYSSHLYTSIIVKVHKK